MYSSNIELICTREHIKLEINRHVMQNVKKTQNDSGIVPQSVCMFVQMNTVNRFRELKIGFSFFY